MRIQITPVHGKWLFCIGMVLLSVAFTYWPDGLHLFRYERALITEQYWRGMTAHFVHLNTPHLLLNLVGLILLVELQWGDFPLSQGLLLLLASCLGVSALLWLQQPQIIWYAGLSGALHGLWSGCALAGLLKWDVTKPVYRIANWSWSQCASAIGMLLLFAKLLVEWRYGPSVQTAQWIGASVVISSHLYGAASGIVYTFLRLLVCRNKKLHLAHDL